MKERKGRGLNTSIGHIPGGSTLKTRKWRKSCLIGFSRSSEDTDHGNGGKHAKTWEENGLASISFSINTTCRNQLQYHRINRFINNHLDFLKARHSKTVSQSNVNWNKRQLHPLQERKWFGLQYSHRKKITTNNKRMKNHNAHLTFSVSIAYFSYCSYIMARRISG